MSDFLSRLAERALGATPPLQPLVGSRFAASAEPAGFVEETVESDASAPALRRSAADASPAARPRPVVEAPVMTGDAPSSTLVPTPAQSHTPSPAQSLTPALDESRTPAPDQPRTPSPDESRTPAPDQPRTPAADEPRTPSPDRTTPDDRAVASSARTFEHDDPAPTVREVAPSARAPEPSPPPARPSSRLPAERVETSRRAQLRVETEPRGDELLIPASTPPDPPAFSPTAAAREDGSAPQTSVEAQRRVAGESMQATEPARQRAEPADEHASDALLMPVARRSEPRAVDGESADRTNARQPWTERQAEKERPVVQVTIGRIEVRAVHPPAAPQPARAPGWTPPVLTLDEYLKRGSGR